MLVNAARLDPPTGSAIPIAPLQVPASKLGEVNASLCSPLNAVTSGIRSRVVPVSCVIASPSSRPPAIGLMEDSKSFVDHSSESGLEESTRPNASNSSRQRRFGTNIAGANRLSA